MAKRFNVKTAFEQGVREYFTKCGHLFGNKNTPMEVSFDVTPELANVSGSLDLNTFTRLRDSPPPDPNTQ